MNCSSDVDLIARLDEFNDNYLELIRVARNWYV